MIRLLMLATIILLISFLGCEPSGSTPEKKEPSVEELEYTKCIINGHEVCSNRMGMIHFPDECLKCFLIREGLQKVKTCTQCDNTGKIVIQDGAESGKSYTVLCPYCEN